METVSKKRIVAAQVLKAFSVASTVLACVMEFLNYHFNESVMPSYFPFGRWIFLVCAVVFALFIWKKPKFTIIALVGYIGYFIWKALYLEGMHLYLCIVLYTAVPILYFFAVFKKNRPCLWLLFVAFIIPFLSHMVRVANNYLAQSRFVEAIIEAFPGYANYINIKISVYGELAMLFVMLGSALFILSFILEYTVKKAKQPPAEERPSAKSPRSNSAQVLNDRWYID